MLKSIVQKSVALTLLFAISLVGSAMQVNATVITMNSYVSPSYHLDVDSGQMTTNLSSDVWYHAVTDSVRYLEPENGALFANLGVVDFDSVTNLSTYTLCACSMNASDDLMPVNTVLVVKTNMGNYAKMRVDSYPNPINFTIVYQADGTPIVPELPSMAIMALFFPATLLAAIVYCRRRRD